MKFTPSHRGGSGEPLVLLLDGVGHGIQVDVPLEAAQLILGVTAA